MKIAILALAASVLVASTTGAQQDTSKLPKDTGIVRTAGGEVASKTFSRLMFVYDAATQEVIKGAVVKDQITGNTSETSATGNVALIPQFVKASGALLTIKKVGYAPIGPVLVDPTSDTTLMVPMSRMAVDLPEMVTTSTKLRSTIEERVRAAGGKLLTSADLNNPENEHLAIGDVLERNNMSPAAATRHRGSVNGFKGQEGSCRPHILLDGNEDVNNLIDLKNDPSFRYAAVEFYRSGLAAPATLMKHWDDCGVIAFWTK